MAAEIRLRSQAGGSVTLKPDDTLTTDEVVEITDGSIVLVSPDGSKWKLTIANDGTISGVKI